MSLRHRLLAGGMWAVAGRMATVISGLAINMLLTRLLTPEQFGAYVLVLTVAGIAALIGQLGVNQAVLRIAADLLSKGRPAMARSAVLKASTIAFFGLTLTAILLASFGGWIGLQLFGSPQIGQAARLMALISVVIGGQAILSDTYRAYQDIRAAAVFGGVLSALFFLLAIAFKFLVNGGASLTDVMMWFVVAYIVAFVIGAINLMRRMGDAGSNDTVSTRDILDVAIPLMLPNLVTILFQLDTWILGVYRPEADVAVYGIAAKVAFIISAPLMVINFAVAPFITEIYAQKDMARLERILRASATLATIPAVLLFIVFFFWDRELLAKLFGEYYRSGGVLLIILSVAQLIVSWTGSCGQVLLMVGKKRLLVGIYAVAGAVLLVVSIVSTPAFGAIGVAVGYLVGTAVLNIGAWMMVKMSLGIYSHSYVLPGKEFIEDLRRVFP